MAISQNPQFLASQLLPEITFNLLSNGITIIANDRLSTPRFLPFDQAGKCRECKSTEVEIDYIITKEGVTIYCSRFKTHRFVQFDYIYEFPGHCIFRVKNKGRVFNVEHGQVICEQPKPIQLQMPSSKKDELKALVSELFNYMDFAIPDSVQAEKMTQKLNHTGGEEFGSFLDALSTVTTFTKPPKGSKISKEQLQDYKKTLSSLPQIDPQQKSSKLDILLTTLAAASTFVKLIKEKKEKDKKGTEGTALDLQQPAQSMPAFDELDSFFGQLNAATAGIPIPAPRANVEVKKEENEGNENVINTKKRVQNSPQRNSSKK